MRPASRAVAGMTAGADDPTEDGLTGAHAGEPHQRETVSRIDRGRIAPAAVTGREKERLKR